MIAGKTRRGQKDCFAAAPARLSATKFAETFHKTPALVAYRVRCGKPGCHCATGERHGPYWFLRWRDGARQRRRYVSAEELDAVRVVITRRKSADRSERLARYGALADLRELKRWLTEIEHGLSR